MGDSRANFFEHLHPATIPARSAAFTYTFGLGGISVLLVLVLLVTGVLLMFLYEPSLARAYSSVAEITYEAPYGWFVRNLHYWAGQWLVITVTLHMARVVFTGGYKRRRANWLIGVGLLVLVLLLDFTGLVLRWDADVSWACWWAPTCCAKCRCWARRSTVWPWAARWSARARPSASTAGTSPG